MSDSDLLIARQHANPHAYLGAHPENGSVVVRTFRPAASKVEVVTPDGTHSSLECVHPGGIFEGHMKGAELPLAYQLEVDYGDSGTITIDDPYRFLPTIGELDVHLLGEGRHEELWERLGAHVTEVDGVTGTAFAVWAPSARAVSVVGDFNYWDGRLHPMRSLGSCGIWELFLPGVGDGAHYKYEILAQDGEIRLKADPVAFQTELPPKTASVVHDPQARLERRGVARGAAQELGARRPDVDLRGPPRLLAAEPARGQPAADLHRAGRRAQRLRQGHGLHPHRADAGDGAPVHGLLGLPGDGLLRPDAALRLPRRLPRVRRPRAPERGRRDPGLGPGALPARRLRARPLRRHGLVRARRPAPRRAPGLGHAGLQLRPPRGPQLPRLQRAVLARRVPRRRHPRRRRGLDAVPGLLAQRGRVGAQPVRRQRGPRRRPVPQGVQRGHPLARAGGRLRRRGIDGLAGRLTPHVPRRAGLRVQVEHGLDARHVVVLPARPDLPPLPPPRADLLAGLRVHGELHPAALARRGRARQGLAGVEDAGRPLAEARQPALAVRLHVGAPRQEAALHGPGVRAGGGVEREPLTRLAPAREPRARGHPVPGPRSQRAPTRPSRRCGRWTSTAAASGGRRPTPPTTT